MFKGLILCNVRPATGLKSHAPGKLAGGAPAVAGDRRPARPIGHRARGVNALLSEGGRRRR
eukprot:4141323-Alexandrium_andersonii.AAC.1